MRSRAEYRNVGSRLAVVVESVVIY